MEKIVQTFEGLIRRSLAPSMTFFVFVALGELIRAELTESSAREQFKAYIDYIGHKPFASSAVFILLALLAIIGLSYALGAVQQLLFDNWMKKNFDPATRFSRSAVSEAQALVELRHKVTKRLRAEPALGDLQELKETSDYVLYEILGGIIPTDTRAFVDTAKSLGIVSVSVILVLLGNAVAYHEQLGPWVAPLLLLALLVYWWGREATLAQYRARALRLYVNFLAMPSARIHKRLARPDEDTASSLTNRKQTP